MMTVSFLAVAEMAADLPFLKETQLKSINISPNRSPLRRLRDNYVQFMKNKCFLSVLIMEIVKTVHNGNSNYGYPWNYSAILTGRSVSLRTLLLIIPFRFSLSLCRSGFHLSAERHDTWKN